MPGLFSCAAGSPIPHKTIVASRAGVYTLAQNACWELDPKPRKRTASDTPFHRPHRAGTHLADAFKYERHTFSPPVNPFVYQRPQGRVAAPLVERLARIPCRGIGGLPNKQILQVFAEAKKWKIAECVPLCPACHY